MASSTSLYHDTVHRLSGVYPQGEATALARMLFEVRFGLSLVDVFMGKDNELSSNQRSELENIMVRLLKNEPIQYVLGETEFCGLTLKVAPGVLIPRPETAELVAWIAEASEHDGQRVLDVGTGSGCIALSLAKMGFVVEACDISDEALAIARDNAECLGLKVGFVRKDILQTSGDENLSYAPYDVVVSNPPYICHSEAESMGQNVLAYEPHTALFVPDDDPLLFYRAIAEFATQYLVKGGWLYFEINRAYAEQTVEMMCDKGFVDIEVRRDQFGNERMVRGRLDL